MLHSDLLARLCRARAALRDLEGSPPTIAAVAKQAGLSRFHFIRAYKALFGATPHQHRSAAQIERAKHLLVLTGRNVTDVCMEVGFSSVGSFSALFKRRVGEPPSAYQRRHCPDARPRDALPSALIPGCFTLMGRLPRTSAISEKPASAASAKLPPLPP